MQEYLLKKQKEYWKSENLKDSLILDSIRKAKDNPYYPYWTPIDPHVVKYKDGSVWEYPRYIDNKTKEISNIRNQNEGKKIK